jgi:hypothetical protein
MGAMFSFLAVLGVSLSLFVSAVSAPASQRADFFGLSATTMLVEEEEAAEAQMLGIGRVRMNIEWGLADLEGPCESVGAPDWTHYDEIFRRAAERHLEVIADLYGNLPSCGNVNAFPASGSGNFTQYAAAAGPGQEGGFVAQVVQRYGVGGSFWAENPSLATDPVTTWEVWNEPNLPHNDPAEIVDPQAYAQFLIATSAAIRGIDPTATVLLGGMSFSGAPASSPKSMAGFLGEIAENPSGYTLDEFQDSFDGVGIHPYAVSGKGPTYEFGGPTVSEERVTEAREILDTLGGGALAEKSMWVTELGWPTEFAPSPEITPAVQANYVTTTMAWLFDHAEEDDIRYAALFDYRDYHPPEGCSEPECWPMYSGMKRLEFLPVKDAPGGSALGEYKIDRPLRCAYKALVSGVSCFAWQAETIGGETSGEPAIASRGVGRLEAFARGAGGVLQGRAREPAGSWSAPEALPPPAAASGPAAVSWDPARVDVVARLADGTVEHWSRGEGQWETENLGGATTDDPAIASWGSGRLDLLVRGTDGSLDHRDWEPATGWTEWEHVPGPPITSSPAAAAPSVGRLDVVADVADGTVEHWTLEGGQWTAENLGGAATSAPALASPAPNRLDAFVRGADGALLHDSWEAVADWSGWTTVPGATIASGPDAVAWNPNRLDVLAEVEGGGLGHWYLER